MKVQANISTCSICGKSQVCELDTLGNNSCDDCFIENMQKFDDHWKQYEKNLPVMHLEQ